MNQLVCTPDVGANLIQMFSISGAAAVTVTFAVLRGRRMIKTAILRGVARARSFFNECN